MNSRGERVVRGRRLLVRPGDHELAGQGVGGALLALSTRAVAAPLVDEGPACDGQEPGPRPIRNALPRPLRQGGQERFLGGVFAGVELAVLPSERGEHLRREFA
jgi:hypothetical protein